MKNVKKTTAALKAKMDELAANQTEIARAQAAINAAAVGAAALERLRKQRSDEIGLAFIEKRAANHASIDKEIAKAEKEAAAADGAKSALQMLESRAAQIEEELIPLQEAQDDAVNAFATAKDAEAQAMLETALAAVNTAFEYMAAAGAISRTRIDIMSGSMPAWRYRLEQLLNAKLHVNMKGSEVILDRLKAELSAAGVTDPGVRRLVKRASAVPSLATPDPVVKITTSQPLTVQEVAHQARFGSAPGHQFN
jgi:hypothetical protein